ncbi:MAG TPA: DoxX family protein [Syntrophorhabdales bacterium]|nr:DoxX family protein [Syntrophorhabdales bacterium]
MVSLEAPCSRWSQALLSVLRIMTGFLFAEHGAQKLFGFLAPPNAHLPLLFSFMGLAGILEFFGGLAVLLGLFTRPAAFVLSGQMAVAYFMAHAPAGFWPLRNKGELAVLYCFIFLYLAAAGGGPWSLGRLLGRDRKSRKAEQVSRSG